MFLISVLGSAVTGQQPAWYLKLQKIIPLESSKGDLEKIFEFPKVRRTFTENEVEFVSYDAGDGKLAVEYSTGTCSSATKDSYDVKEDTVLRMIFFPKDPVKFSKFKIEKEQFIKTTDGHDPGWKYVNKSSGLNFSVQRKLVDYVEILPSSRHDRKKCQ